jgi:hypothetical protein
VTTFATTLGALPPGVVYSNTADSFFAVASTAANQALVSTGADSFAFLPQQNLPSPAFSRGIVQMALTTVGGSTLYPIYTNLTTVGSSSSNYNAAAVVLSGNFVPNNGHSIVKIEWSMTINNTQDFGVANLYLFPTLNPAPFGSSGDSTFQSGDIAVSCKGSVFFNPGLTFIDEIPFAICVFKTGTGSTGGINQSDYVLFTEYAAQPSGSLDIDPFVLVGATPVVVTTIDLTSNPTSTARYYTGTVLYADAANLISNVQAFQFLVQYNFTSNTTTASIGPSNSLAAAPFLTYAVVGNIVTISAVGIAGETFNCKMIVEMFQGGI